MEADLRMVVVLWTLYTNLAHHSEFHNETFVQLACMLGICYKNTERSRNCQQMLETTTDLKSIINLYHVTFEDKLSIVVNSEWTTTIISMKLNFAKWQTCRCIQCVTKYWYYLKFWQQHIWSILSKFGNIANLLKF